MTANVRLEQRKALQDFRASHPYQSLDVGGITRRYTVSGAGPRALVFLPGAFMEADMWFYMITALENSYRIVALSCSHDSFTVEREVAATLAMMDAENIDSAILIGLSFGGGILQCLLQDHPGRVEHAVLSHCSDVRVENAATLKKVLRLVRFVPRIAFKWLLRRRANRKYPESSEWVEFTRAYFAECLEGVGKTTVLRFLKDAAYSEVPEQFDALDDWQGDILLLSTADDPVSTPRLDALRERYPRSTTTILPEGGHHTLFLFPEAYCEALSAFLRDVGGDET